MHLILGGIALFNAIIILSETTQENLYLLWVIPVGFFPSALILFLKNRFKRSKIQIDENHIMTIIYPLGKKEIPLEQIKTMRYVVSGMQHRKIANYVLLDGENKILGLFNARLYSKEQMLELGKVLQYQVKNFKSEL